MRNISIYREQYKNSFASLLKHPILLAPDIIFSLLSVGVAIFVLKALGVLALLTEISGMEDSAMVIPLVYTFLKENIIKLLFSVVLFFMGTFVVGTTLSGTKFAMVRDLISNKKPSFKKGLADSKKYFWRIIGIKILTVFAYIVGTLASVIIFGVFTPINQKVAIGIALVLGTILYLVIQLSLFFKFPILYKKNTSSYETIKMSYHFFKANKKFTLVVACIVAVTLLVINQIFKLIFVLLKTPSVFLFTLTGIIGILATMFTIIYTFSVFEKYKSKQ
ncbi:MAG: hypothetical protein AABX72_00465 [Nanoarchaeota archaeon]